MTNKTASEVASVMSDFVNNFGCDKQAFVNEMAKDHRTLQQSFTKLCLKWIEYVGSDEYRFDLRNEDSHTTCKAMISAFKKENDNWNPSDYLRMI
jgi:hypothetical protein